jgi:hypothetical protein
MSEASSAATWEGICAVDDRHVLKLLVGCDVTRVTSPAMTISWMADPTEARPRTLRDRAFLWAGVLAEGLVVYGCAVTAPKTLGEARDAVVERRAVLAARWL